MNYMTYQPINMHDYKLLVNENNIMLNCVYNTIIIVNSYEIQFTRENHTFIRANCELDVINTITVVM